MSDSIHIPFSKISLYHRLKFVSYDAYSLNPLDEVVVDSVHAIAVHLDKYRNGVASHFDTAIIQIRAGMGEGFDNLNGSVLFLSQIYISLQYSTRSMYWTSAMHFFFASTSSRPLVSNWHIPPSASHLR